MNWVTRKIASKLKPTVIFSFPAEDKFQIEYQTMVKNMTQEQMAIYSIGMNNVSL